jgi:hypothetical protein
MEIGRLACDPRHEPGERGIFDQPGPVRPDPRQSRIVETGMDRAMADRMQGNDITPAPAFGHRMVPLAPLSERTAA